MWREIPEARFDPGRTPAWVGSLARMWFRGRFLVGQHSAPMTIRVAFDGARYEVTDPPRAAGGVVEVFAPPTGPLAPSPAKDCWDSCVEVELADVDRPTLSRMLFAPRCDFVADG